MNPLRIVVVLCLLYATTRAHAAFPIIDSGAWVRSGGSRVIFWIDKETLLFLGHDGIKPQTGGEIRVAMLQWVVGNPITLLRRDVDGLCYRPGQVRIVVSDKSTMTRTVYEGPLGSEAPVQPKSYDPLNCDSSYDPTSSPGARRIRRLRPGHGHLDFGPLNSQDAESADLAYVTSNGRKFQLPFGERDVFAGFEYYAFRNAYFFRLGYRSAGQTGATNVWPSGLRAKAYWLWPGGKIELVEFPGDVAPQPTAAGMVYRITGLDEGKNGLYLLGRDEKREVVLAGYVTEISVAPDGCRVAFAHAPDRYSNMTRPKNRRTLKVADLCSRRTK
jgi:hypothetical protein